MNQEQIDECVKAGLPVDSRLCKICTGSVFPAEITNGYRRIWGLDPLPDDLLEQGQSSIIKASPPRIQRLPVITSPRESRPVKQRIRRSPPAEKSNGKKAGGCGCNGGRASLPLKGQVSPNPVKLELNGYGPGSQLLKLWKDMPHCDACYAMAAQMDAWGKDECAKRLDQIVADILPRAQTWMKDNKPWVHKMLAVTSTEQAVLKLAVSTNVRKAIRLAT